MQVADLLDIVAGELEDVRWYVLQHGHNVHRHLHHHNTALITTQVRHLTNNLGQSHEATGTRKNIYQLILIYVEVSVPTTQINSDAEPDGADLKFDLETEPILKVGSGSFFWARENETI